MIETTFYLDTAREIFEDWLAKTCQVVKWAEKAGKCHVQHVRMEPHGRVIIAGLLIKTYEKDGQREGYYDPAWTITFEILRLTSGKIEVWGSCSGDDQTEAAYLELLAMIGARWPESRLAALLAPGDDAAPAGIAGEETTSTPNARKLARQNKVREYRERGMSIVEIAASLTAGVSTIKLDLKELGLSKSRSKT